MPEDTILAMGRAAFKIVADAEPHTAGAALDVARTLLAHRQHELIKAVPSGDALPAFESR